MPGQGAVTISIANAIRQNQKWHLVYSCVPNTTHLGVVPIPTPMAVGNQRYPDVVAVNKEIVWLIEVEIRLTMKVARDIQHRFAEMKSALSQEPIWKTWRNQVERVAGLVMPTEFSSRTTLVICTGNPGALVDEIRFLDSNSIETLLWNDICLARIAEND